MAMNIGNTFFKPSTRFALLRHTFFACRWCVFKASRARPRMQEYLWYVCKCASVLVCLCECLTSHLGDKKLTRANFTAFIPVLLVTRPSANHTAPHREGKKEKRAALKSLPQSLSLSLSLFSCIRSTLSLARWGAEITPQGHGIAASL